MDFDISPDELIDLILKAYHERYGDAKRDARLKRLREK